MTEEIILTTTSTIGVIVGNEDIKTQETIKIINTPPIQDEKPPKKKNSKHKKDNTKKNNSNNNNNNLLSFYTPSTTKQNNNNNNNRKDKITHHAPLHHKGKKIQNSFSTSALPFCAHFYSCTESQDPRHTKQFRHICSLGQSCTQKDDPKHSRMWYHFNLPVCPKTKECDQLTDPLHRASFHHPGFSDSMMPCRFHKDCKKIDDRNHLLRYQHSNVFYFPQDSVAPIPEFSAIVSKKEDTEKKAVTSPITSSSTNNSTSSEIFPPLNTEEEKKEEAEKEIEVKKEEDKEEEEKSVDVKQQQQPIAVPAEIVDAAYAEMMTSSSSSSSSVSGKKEHLGSEKREKRINNTNTTNNTNVTKELTPCSHPFECRVKVDEGHMYYHACSSSKAECHILRRNALNNNTNNIHSKHFVHYSNEKCKQGKSCPFIYDPQHRAYFAHQNEPDFLIPCKFATKCKLLDDPQHRLHFQHFEHHFFPPFPPTFQPEAKAPVADNGGIPLCNAFFACPLIADPAHEAQAMHACPWGQDCDKVSEEFHRAHYYHYEHPLCGEGENCMMLNDPLHRAQFHHKGLPDFVVPCGFGRTCSHISNPEHCSMYQHGVIPILPCVPPVVVERFVEGAGRKMQGYHGGNGKFGGNGGGRMQQQQQQQQGFQFNIFTPMMFYQGMKKKQPQQQQQQQQQHVENVDGGENSTELAK